MKTFYLVFLLLAVALATPESDSMPGAFSPHRQVDLEDPYVFKAVQACVSHIAAGSGETYKMNDFEVLSVQMKVVAGIIYRIHLALPTGDGMGKHFRMEVFRDLSSNYSVESSEYLGISPLPRN
ncbi:hypothetical protein P9112_006942 [Eukaryota sp. TZLM1-RC]